MPNLLVRLLWEKVGNPFRYACLTRILAPHLSPYRMVLDIGASNGALAASIAKQVPGISFTGIDTLVQPKTSIPVQPYDGRHLPFADDSYECAMMVDVLHHDPEPKKIIQEARRVAHRLVIKDHYWTNAADLGLLRWLDAFGNRPYGIAVPQAYLQLPDWARLFKECGLRIVSQATFRFNVFDPVRHVLYTLERAG